MPDWVVGSRWNFRRPGKEKAVNPMIAFAKWLAGQRSYQYFRASEIGFLGESNRNKASSAFGLNRLPDQTLWANCLPTIDLLERARAELGIPVFVLSGYRNAAYNAAVGGASGSWHMKFRAFDVTCARPADLRDVLLSYRAAADFAGGIGWYPGRFVHVDTRGSNADWTG